MRPVLAGLWKQHETWDGTYDIHDLIVVNQLLDARDENSRRAHEAAQEAAERNRSRR